MSTSNHSVPYQSWMIPEHDLFKHGYVREPGSAGEMDVKMDSAKSR